MTTKLAYSLQFAAATSLAVLAAGCGDGPICPSELVMVIQSPADGSTLSEATDDDPIAAGVQTSVAVRSNFDSGAEMTLTVTDDLTGAVSLHEATADANGTASFSDITLPSGPVTLFAEGASDCGTANDESKVDVVTDSICTLTIVEGPIENSFYAPIPVLNSATDSDAALPNFQANFDVQSAPGFQVEVFVLDVDVGSEASIGTGTADADGVASFQATLAQGRQVVRATCVLNGASAASATNTVQVDTIVPACSLTNPTEGVTITPDFDEDADDLNGIQMTWSGSVDDGDENDTEGERAGFFRDSTEFDGRVIDEDGNSDTVLAEFTAPGSYALAFSTQDHAANTCISGFTTDVIMDGCAIAIEQPSGAGSASGTFIADSDGNDANGLQANVVVQVGTECAGLDVFVDCGLGESSATAPGDGATQVTDVTIDSSAASEGSVACTARVVNSADFTTTNQATLSYDTLAPGVVLSFVDPVGLRCGDTIVFGLANDVNGNLADGFQIEATFLSGPAEELEFRLVNSSCAAPDGCITANSGVGGTLLTLELGNNDIRAIARDVLGNEATSPACNIALADIAVEVDPPVDGGVLSSNDGTLNGGALEVTVCGTVSENDVTVTVALDGGTPAAATVGVGAWCTDAPVVFSEGTHTLVALAESNADASVGSATITVNVDLSAPNPPTGLTASVPNRHTIDADWAPQGDAADYMVRISNAPFVDFANEGEQFAVSPATSATISQLAIGQTYFLGVAAVDPSGNLSAPATLGPFVPALDATGGRFAPNAGDGNDKRLGYDVASADFDGDGFQDIAVSAPGTTIGGVDFAGAVQVYRGGANGIGATPDITINGAATPSEFGWGLTAINWGGGAEDGLAVGSPFSDGTNGEVFIFHDTTIASALVGGTNLSVADADITISVNPAANWFSVGAIGASLAAGQVDADGTREDLIIGAVLGGGAAGGVAVIYGQPVMPASISLSDVSDPGVRGHIFQNPEAGAIGALLGFSVEYLGDTRAGDGVGDFAASYLTDALGIDERTFVLRGRTPPAAGFEFITLGASDLTIVLAGSGGATTSFGESMASIALQPFDGFRDIVLTSGRNGAGHLYLIDGSQTGTVTIDAVNGFLADITQGTGARFATGVANNAIADNADINNDGLEDLLVVGGRAGIGDGVLLYVWLSEDIPTGSVLTATATHTIAGPASFTGTGIIGQKLAKEVHWIGDTNNDGLEDICWADYFHTTADGQDGTFEVLWDESP